MAGVVAHMHVHAHVEIHTSASQSRERPRDGMGRDRMGWMGWAQRPCRSSSGLSGWGDGVIVVLDRVQSSFFTPSAALRPLFLGKTRSF